MKRNFEKELLFLVSMSFVQFQLWKKERIFSLKNKMVMETVIYILNGPIHLTALGTQAIQNNMRI